MSKFIEFIENEIFVTFEITDNNKLLLLNMSNKPCEIPSARESLAYRVIDIAVTGRSIEDQHGAKHTGGIELKYVSHTDTVNEYGRILKFRLTDNTLDVYMNYQFYDGISAVRSYAEVKNISDENIGLEYVSSFSLAGIEKGGNVNDTLKIYIPHMGYAREFDWHKYNIYDLGFWHNQPFSSKRIAASETGTWTTKEYLPMGCLINEDANTSIMWQIESNASWNWEISDICDVVYLKLSGPSENENGWWKNLKPNETFVTVNTAIVFSDGNFNASIEELTKYRRTIKRKHQADAHLPVIFNDYLNCLKADPTTEKLLPIIDRAAEAGAEYFCMDAGWYTEGAWWDAVGEWLPCKSRSPSGIEEVADYVRSKGMVFGMWIEIEVMGTECAIASEFEDNCFFMRHGKRVVDHGRYQFDFRNEKVQKYAESVIDRLVNDYKLGYIKIDYNINMGLGTEVNSDSFGDGLLQASRAYINWINSIMDKYPDLIIESCAGGGMKIDYATMSNFPLVSISDQSNDFKMSSVAFASATAVLPEQAAVWAFPAPKMCRDEIAYDMIGAMLTRMHLSGKIPWLNEEQFEIVKNAVLVYKNIRKDISASTPFYPLGVESYNKKYLCAGYKNADGAYLAVWNNDDEKGAVVNIPVQYKNAEIIFSSDDVTLSAQENEITVNFPRKRMAAIIKCF